MLGADAAPALVEEGLEIRSFDLHWRKLDEREPGRSHERSRHTAGGERHRMSGSGEGSGERGGAGQVAGPEKMGDGDEDPKPHSANCSESRGKSPPRSRSAARPTPRSRRT